MSGGGAGNRREVGEVAVGWVGGVAGGGVGIGERRPRNRRAEVGGWVHGRTERAPEPVLLYAGGLEPMGRLLLSPVCVRLVGD